MASSGTPTSHSKDKGKGKQGQMQHQLDQINGVEGESVGVGNSGPHSPPFLMSHGLVGSLQLELWES